MKFFLSGSWWTIGCLWWNLWDHRGSYRQISETSCKIKFLCFISRHHFLFYIRQEKTIESDSFGGWKSPKRIAICLKICWTIWCFIQKYHRISIGFDINIRQLTPTHNNNPMINLQRKKNISSHPPPVRSHSIFRLRHPSATSSFFSFCFFWFVLFWHLLFLTKNRYLPSP